MAAAVPILITFLGAFFVGIDEGFIVGLGAMAFATALFWPAIGPILGLIFRRD